MFEAWTAFVLCLKDHFYANDRGFEKKKKKKFKVAFLDFFGHVRMPIRPHLYDCCPLVPPFGQHVLRNKLFLPLSLVLRNCGIRNTFVSYREHHSICSLLPSVIATPLFYQIEPLKNGPSQVLPSKIINKNNFWNPVRACWDNPIDPLR